MKTISVAITVITLALTGCAPGYYQQGYSSYGTGYGATSYGGYGGSYYSTPSSGYYYQPGSVYGYDQYYTPSYPSHHGYYGNWGHHGDRDDQRGQERHESWIHGGPRRQDNQANPYQAGEHGGMNRWNNEMSQQQQDNFDKRVERAQHHQGAMVPQMQSNDGFGSSQRNEPGQDQHSRHFSSAVPGGGDMSSSRSSGNEGRGHGHRHE